MSYTELAHSNLRHDITPTISVGPQCLRKVGKTGIFLPALQTLKLRFIEKKWGSAQDHIATMLTLLVSNSGLLTQRLESFSKANVTTSEGSGIKKTDSTSLWLMAKGVGSGGCWQGQVRSQGQSRILAICGSPWSLKPQNEEKTKKQKRLPWSFFSILGSPPDIPDVEAQSRILVAYFCPPQKAKGHKDLSFCLSLLDLKPHRMSAPSPRGGKWSRPAQNESVGDEEMKSSSIFCLLQFLRAPPNFRST